MRASTRTAGSIPAHSAVSEVLGSVTDPKHIHATLAGATAACVVLGPRPPYTDIFCGEATRLIVQQMRDSGTSRLICQTGAMIGHYPENRTRLFNLMARSYQRRNVRPHQDRVDQEEAVRSSDLSWVLLKPPRLRDRQGARIVQVGPDVRVGLLSSVARSDLASFIVGEILQPRFEAKTLFVRG